MRDLTSVMHLDYDVPHEDMQVDSTDQVTVPDHTFLFQTIFDSLFRAFTQWHRTVPNKDARVMTKNDFKLNVNECVDVDVIWGRRGHGKGYWTGHLGVIPGRVVVEKLKVGYHPTPIFGVQIGGIEDFNGYDSMVFYGENGRIYYTPCEFTCPEYEEGWNIVNVYGGFTMEHFGAQNILDPASIRTSII